MCRTPRVMRQTRLLLIAALIGQAYTASAAAAGSCLAPPSTTLTQDISPAHPSYGTGPDRARALSRYRKNLLKYSAASVILGASLGSAAYAHIHALVPGMPWLGYITGASVMLASTIALGRISFPLLRRQLDGKPAAIQTREEDAAAAQKQAAAAAADIATQMRLSSFLRTLEIKPLRVALDNVEKPNDDFPLLQTIDYYSLFATVYHENPDAREDLCQKLAARSKAPSTAIGLLAACVLHGVNTQEGPSTTDDEPISALCHIMARHEPRITEDAASTLHKVYSRCSSKNRTRILTAITTHKACHTSSMFTLALNCLHDEAKEEFHDYNFPDELRYRCAQILKLLTNHAVILTDNREQFTTRWATIPVPFEPVSSDLRVAYFNEQLELAEWLLLAPRLALTRLLTLPSTVPDVDVDIPAAVLKAA